MKNIKDALLQSLEELSKIATHKEIYDLIAHKSLYDFGKTKKPLSTVSAELGNFIRKGDTRVKRIPVKGGSFVYYLTKQEGDLGIDEFVQKDTASSETGERKQPEKSQEYGERDLHKLLSTYLKGQDTYAKTIFHEVSTSKDQNQIWTHPDMVGVRFADLKHKVSKGFMNTVDRLAGFDLYSYELKRKITTDNELKQAYFQAVSNSSWANYGYLVAFTISSNLHEEIERLTQSFGIGVVELDANPYQSKILYQAAHRPLNFRTIDKLCNINRDFAAFIEQVEKVVGVQDRYHDAVKNELERLCDSYLTTEAEIAAYCHEKNIPVEYYEITSP